MQRTSFRDMTCSLARSLDIAGEPWTPLILRDIWMGRTRFDEIHEDLEVSRKLLAERLDTLIGEKVLTRKRYQDRPARYEYHLTEKGKELMVVLLALLSWGDRWTAGKAGAPMLMRHRACGEIASAEVTCSSCGQELHANEVWLEPGPGLRIGRGSQPLPERHPFYEASLDAMKRLRSKSRATPRKPAASHK
jgi:DNA-binding HxlR family transcriptional regulator